VIAERLRRHLGLAAVVGITIYVVDGQLRQAVAVTAIFLAFHLLNDAAEALIGDYAGNALFGITLLAGTAWASIATSVPLWQLVVVAVVGAWLLLDGVQHLRYGVTRDATDQEVLPADAYGVWRAPAAVVGRIVEPFRLG
jgi:hypothetical protein